LTHLNFLKRIFKFCTVFAFHNTDKFLKDVHPKPKLINEFYQLYEKGGGKKQGNYLKYGIYQV